MSGIYLIFSIRRPAAASSLCAGLLAMQLLFAFGFLVSPSNGIPVALPQETSSSTTTTAPTSTVKILIPPSSSSDDSEDDDAVIIEAGNGTFSPLPHEPFQPSDCFMDKEKGPCRAIIDMWYFNVATKTCEQFQYSGCGGNGNRFSEKNECDNRCNGKEADQTTDDNDDDTVVIEAESEENSDNNGTCSKFAGCGPLKCAVIKDEKTGCKKCACSHNPDDDEDQTNLPVGSVSGKPSEDDDEKMKKEKPEDVCGLPEVRGSCRAMITRFRYDSASKKCIMFHFGGCDSNGNNFVSEEKCMEFCKGQ